MAERDAVEGATKKKRRKDSFAGGQPSTPIPIIKPIINDNSQPGQNVACDSCKFRRIKCDLSDLLSAVPGSASRSGSSCTIDTPLAQLVRENPDVECTNCRSKGVRCTAEQILNPSKPNKGGRRIDEAKKRFGKGIDGEEKAEKADEGRDGRGVDGPDGRAGEGDGFGVHSMGSAGVAEGLDGLDWEAIIGMPGMDEVLAGLEGATGMAGMSSAQAGMGFMAPMGAGASTGIAPSTAFDFAAFTTPAGDSATQATWNAHGGSMSFDSTGVNLDSNGQYNFSHNDPVPLFASSSTSRADSFAPAQASSGASIHSANHTTAQSPNPDPRRHLRYNLSPRDTHAEGIWTQLAEGKSPQHIPPIAPTQIGPKFQTAQSSTASLEGHTSSGVAPAFPSSFKFDGGPTKFIPYDATPDQVASSQVWSNTTPAINPRAIYRPQTSDDAPVSMYFRAGQSLFPPGYDAGLVPARKRQRSEFSATPESEGQDPWKLWGREGGREMVRWGRREVVQQRMADRALGGEMSKHLVMTFFHCVHPSFPALSPEGFYLEWERAGQMSERMTPAQETLCAVMEAWGARYSDSPIVLGLSPSRAAMAPKVIQANGTLAAGTQARAHWGKARLDVCNALADRARKLIDANALLRKPSVTGLQALLLYNQLLHLTDQRSRAASQFMENQMIHASIIEQLKLLQLMWDSTGQIPAEEGEIPATMGQNRMKQRRIFWTIIVSDAFNAAASGDLPKIADSELESVAQWLSDVEAKLPLSVFKTLAFFMSCYHRIALSARAVAKNITHPNLKPGTVDVNSFCRAVRDSWAQAKSISRDITVITAELLQSCDHNLLGFSPMNYITNLRMSCPFLLLVTHQAIREQLDFRKTMKESYIMVDTPRTNSSRGSGSGSGESPSSAPGSENVAKLEELHLQSVDVVLNSCRSQMEMYQTILPTGMVQTASIFLRVLIASAQFLAEVPTNEQGYPANTLGGYEWTWENKQKEVGICVDALYQLGWAWADASEVLDSVMLSMERMTPTPDQLEAYKASSSSMDIDERIVVARLVDESNDSKLFDRAMRFWPPQSIPAVIEHAMRDLRISGDDPSPRPLDVTEDVPWDDLARIAKRRASSQSTRSDLDDVGYHRDSSARLHAQLALNGSPAQDIAEAAGAPWGEGAAANVRTLSVGPSASESAFAPAGAKSSPGPWGYMAGSTTHGWTSANGSADDTAARAMDDAHAGMAHLNGTHRDFPFGTIQADQTWRVGQSQASWQQERSNHSNNLGPMWSISGQQQSNTPIATAAATAALPTLGPIPHDAADGTQAERDLNSLLNPNWLDFHSFPAASGAGVDGGAPLSTGTSEGEGDGEEYSGVPSVSIEEFMRNFEEVTSGGTGYHGPRP